MIVLLANTVIVEAVVAMVALLVSICRNLVIDAYIFLMIFMCVQQASTVIVVVIVKDVPRVSIVLVGAQTTAIRVLRVNTRATAMEPVPLAVSTVQVVNILALLLEDAPRVRLVKCRPGQLDLAPLVLLVSFLFKLSL